MLKAHFLYLSPTPSLSSVPVSIIQSQNHYNRCFIQIWHAGLRLISHPTSENSRWCSGPQQLSPIDTDTCNSDSKPLQGTEGPSKLAVKSFISFNSFSFCYCTHFVSQRTGLPRILHSTLITEEREGTTIMGQHHCPRCLWNWRFTSHKLWYLLVREGLQKDCYRDSSQAHEGRAGETQERSQRKTRPGQLSLKPLSLSSALHYSPAVSHPHRPRRDLYWKGSNSSCCVSRLFLGFLFLEASQRKQTFLRLIGYFFVITSFSLNSVPSN